MEIVEQLDVHAQRALIADSPENLIGLMDSLAKLQGQANNSHKIKQSDRRLDLEERKFEGRFVKLFAKYYEDRQVKDIMAGKEKGQIRLDQLALRIFGARPDLEPLNVS